MAFQRTAADDRAMISFLEKVLDAHKDGRLERDLAVSIVAHAIAAAQQDEADHFKRHIRLPIEAHLDD